MAGLAPRAKLNQSAKPGARRIDFWARAILNENNSPLGIIRNPEEALDNQ
jgi:hypothetical protein